MTIERTILPLPLKTISLLRSSLIIPSLTSILIELIQNSLDAKSNNIILSFQLNNWTIKCEDDGFGLTLKDLLNLSREGEGEGDEAEGAGRYWTSKLNLNNGISKGFEEVNTFGFRGEALASLADVALLEILTKSTQSKVEETCSLLFRGGEKIYTGISNLKRNSFGTTVWVREIFYMWPVRRKPLSTPSSRLAIISSFRISFSTIALIHPHIAFTLQDTDSSNSSTPKRLIQVSRTGDGILGRWKQLWGRAGVEKVVVIEKWEELEGGKRGGEKFGVEGFFSLTASHSKASQFIYINARPLAPCYLHKLINYLFSQSTFSKNSPSHLVDTFSSDKNQYLDGTKATRKSPKKVSERCPIFVLNLKAPGGLIDLTLEPEKRKIEFQDPERVYKFVEQVVKSFLVENGFLASPPPLASLPLLPPAKESKKPHKSSVIPTNRPYLISKPIESPSSTSTPRALPPSIESQEIFAHPKSRNLDPTTSHNPKGATEIASPLIRWTDPSTRQTFLVDPRTGNSRREEFDEVSRTQSRTRIGRVDSIVLEDTRDGSCACENESGMDEISERNKLRRTTLVDRSRLRKRERVEESSDDNTDGEEEEDLQLEGTVREKKKEKEVVPSWILKTLSNWENPIFQTSESLIPSLPSFPLDDSILPASSTLKDSQIPFKSTRPNSHHISHKKIQAFYQNTVASTVNVSSTLGSSQLDTIRGSEGQKFRREDLRTGEFLAQVDRKFLLVKLRVNQSLNNLEDTSIIQETLILIDQHAASERIRVEKYLKDYCGSVVRGFREVKVYTFEEPKRLILSREEVVQLRENGGREECRKWGIGIDFLSSITSEVEEEMSDYVQVELTFVPLVVADRLKVEPRLQQELIRSFLAQLVDEVGKGRGGAGGSRRNFGLRGEGEEKNWVSVMRRCPLVLVDLINSKACRGAIMFNDELTPLQCQKLITELADTVYPFQCAHGRPSLVPLVNLANSNSKRALVGREGKREINWSRLEKM